MGCTPSRGEVSDSELLREIELLKSNQTEQAEVITRLRHENEKLRQGLENQGFHVDEGPNHNEDILFKEIEQLKISQTKLEEENETLKKKLVKANGVSNFYMFANQADALYLQTWLNFGKYVLQVGTQSPQKPIKQDQPKNKNLPKVGDPVCLATDIRVVICGKYKQCRYHIQHQNQPTMMLLLNWFINW